MSQFAFDNNVSLIFIKGPIDEVVADFSAPTTGEIAEGIDLSTELERDGGWNPNINPTKVEGGALSQMFTTTAHGTRAVELTATFLRHRNDEADKDLAWETFALGVEGVFIYRDGMPYDAPYADGQRVQVWPVVSDDPIPNAATTNTMANCTVGFAHPAEPVLKAVVGGGS